MSESPNRKLIAIMFADIAGYTDMMQKNEEKALSAVAHFERIIETTISSFKGKVVNYLGDGCLMTFQSSTDAVAAAIVMQEQFMFDDLIPVRIGIHAGDVVMKNENVFGNGVNIASRIESLGIPGCILFSKSIRDEIRNKSEFKLVSLGDFEFKNVEESMEVFALGNEPFVVPERHEMKGKLKPESEKKKTASYSSLWYLILLVPLFLIVGYYLPELNSGEDPEKILTALNKGKKYYVSIGINQYPFWRNLKNAQNDAVKIGQTLEKYYDFSPLTPIILNNNADKSSLENIFKESKTRLKPEDQLIVYFAGHGYNDHGGSLDNDPKGYLVPYDANTDTDFSDLIPINSFLDKIAELPPKHITTFLDACFSGLALQDEVYVSRGGGLNLIRAIKNESRKVFSSAEYNQIAQDSGPIQGHSLFSGLLIQGLQSGIPDQNKDGIISMHELANFLEEEMNSVSTVRQNPTFGEHKTDKGGEMLLAYNKLTAITPVSDFIPQEKDLYTAVAFRSTTTEEGLDNLSQYIPDQIIQAISEIPNRPYDVYYFSDAMATDTFNHSVILRNINPSYYFSGSFKVIDDQLTINVYLRDGNTTYILYSFPPISGNKNQIEEAIFQVKNRVKGFLKTDIDVKEYLIYPPDYEAYRLYLQANEVYVKNRDGYETRRLLKRALDIDPTYSSAQQLMVMSYLECSPAYVDSAEMEYEKLISDPFKLTEFQEERIKLLEMELTGNYPLIVDTHYNYFLKHPHLSTFLSALWYAMASNKLSLMEKLFTETYRLRNPEDLPVYLDRWKFIYYLVSKNRPPEIDEYLKKFEQHIEKNDHRDFNYINYIRLKIAFDCQGNCLEKIDRKLAQKGVQYPDCYIAAGDYFQIYNKPKEASKAYRLAMDYFQKELKVADSLSFNDTLQLQTIHFKLKNYDRVIQIFEDYEEKFTENHLAQNIGYYLISRYSLNGKLSKKDNDLLNGPVFTQNKYYEAIGYYYAGMVESNMGNFEEALLHLKKASKGGMSKNPQKYCFDADMYPIFSYPEFQEFMRPI